MGQGNSQLAVYGKLGVLYDCGSSSQLIHHKLRALSSGKVKFAKRNIENLEINNLFTGRNRLNRKEEFHSLTAENLKNIANTRFDKKDHVESQGSEGDFSNGENTSNEARDNIRQVIEEHKLKHLFIFISHPDADHYDKLISPSHGSAIKGALPDNLPVTVFLCGDWLNKEEKIEEENRNKKVLPGHIDFIRRLFKRDKTDVYFPHYFNYISKKNDASCNEPALHYELLHHIFYHNKLMDDTQFKEKFGEKLKDFKSYNYPNNHTVPFFGNLEELILQIRNSNSYSKFKEELKETTSEDYPYDQFMRCIYIHLMNQRFDDINSQSAILSFNMPGLKMKFICTGDAHDETFQYLNILNNPNVQTDLNSSTNVLIVPHHGSSGNISRKMLEMFNPELCVISAGNGVQHGHPNNLTVDAYKNAVELGLISKNFFSKFAISEPGLLAISYPRKGNTKIGCISNLDEQRIPLMSTNVHGTIKFDNEGIWGDFTNIVEITQSNNGRERIDSYNVNFKIRSVDSKHLSGINKSALEEIGEGIIRENDKYYYMVQIDDLTQLFYDAEQIGVDVADETD
ncbi:MAG: hypothetical protein C0425_11085 [Chlorobiaceae bacterium]|nr:hypothetical protein [Chlorobiaceae bacterium]